jgi:thiol:disulfide interchange protein/DsbC/DsbD-like thiol-disulfide interchange protein
MPVPRAILMFLLLLVCGMQVRAQTTTNHIKAELIAETNRPAPGKTLTLALAMTPERDWHGYWKNPGDAGMETRVIWTLPEGVTAGALEYPVPHRLLLAGLMNYIYESAYAHLVQLEIPAGLTPATKLPIRAEVDWLACTKEICVPEKATLALDLIVGDVAVQPANRSRFDAYRAAMPQPLGQPARFAMAGDRFRIAIPVPTDFALDDPYFYPLTDGALSYSEPQKASRSGDYLILETAAGSGGDLRAVEGVLAMGQGKGLSLTATPGLVPTDGKPLAPSAKEASSGLLATILLSFGAAVLGGIVLNIMPCVFPILSLKALSLAKAGPSAIHARRDALVYAAGVILVCVGLGVLLLSLRSGGQMVGWAFQLQDPRVSLLLLLLVCAIGFNLAGLFELPMLPFGGGVTAGEGAGSAFWTGALAAFVATPCTGPFMAGALGAALVLPGAAAIAIFFGLGVGIALPFLALGFIPALRNRLPRPGAWMETARHILSIPMFVTALGLAWILGRQAGVNAMAIGIGGAMLLACALWWGGARQRKGRSRAWWPAIPVLGAALASIALLPREQPAIAQTVSDTVFSESKLASLRGAGTPVFLYFTADWCLSCKVNEKAAIERAEVEDAFERGGVVTLVGDWTRGDPAISRFLAERGRAGVPLYLFYPAGGGEPKELPQVLTPSMLVALAG